MLKFVNIYGPSGSGKTQYIIQNAFRNANLLNSILRHDYSIPAISLLPLAEFEGTVENYLKVFDIESYFTPKFISLSKILIGENAGALLKRQYNSLSAGEKRRLDIIRCSLCSNAIIVDEPFSNSSAEYADQILDILQTNFQLIIMLNHREYQKCFNIHVDQINYKNGHQSLIDYISQSSPT